MKTKIHFFFGLMMCVFIIIAHNANGTGIKISGTGKISGNVYCTAAKLPLNNFTVTLFSAIDSSMVSGTITDNNGSFYFSMLEQGKYYLEINEEGFEKQQITDIAVDSENSKIELDNIILAPLKMSKKIRRKIFGIKL